MSFRNPFRKKNTDSVYTRKYSDFGEFVVAYNKLKRHERIVEEAVRHVLSKFPNYLVFFDEETDEIVNFIKTGDN